MLCNSIYQFMIFIKQKMINLAILYAYNFLYFYTLLICSMGLITWRWIRYVELSVLCELRQCYVVVTVRRKIGLLI